MREARHFPLSWPAGWTRRTSGRRRAAFKASSSTVSIAVAIDRLDKQLRLLGAKSDVLSTNVEPRLDGLPKSNRADPDDTGVAVYFKLKGKDRCLACDKYDRVADNIVAIAKHVDALRRIDRYGVGTLDQAFAGYAQLPAQAASWFIVLEFDAPPKDFLTVAARFQELAAKHHPDRGGSLDTMQKLGEAYATAKDEFGIK